MPAELLVGTGIEVRVIKINSHSLACYTPSITREERKPCLTFDFDRRIGRAQVTKNLLRYSGGIPDRGSRASEWCSHGVPRPTVALSPGAQLPAVPTSHCSPEVPSSPDEMPAEQPFRRPTHEGCLVRPLLAFMVINPGLVCQILHRHLA